MVEVLFKVKFIRNNPKLYLRSFALIFWKSAQFWLVTLIVFATVVLMAAVYLDWLNLSFRISGLYFTHWLSLVGTLFILIYTPIYYILRRLYPIQGKKLLAIHVFGNLFAFLLVSIHFAGQVGRPVQFFPEGRTGIALYIITLTTVAAGILHRFGLLSIGKFQFPKRTRFVHVALSLSFYIVVVVHILHNIGYL